MALSAVPALYQRRLTLTVRTPRELLVPLVTPFLFAVIIAPRWPASSPRRAREPLT